jgi:micrococcal nuclease
MKKNYLLILFLTMLFIFPYNVKANEKVNVTFDRCVDGDTASFIYNNESIKVRFLAIDTPETKHPTKGVEPYGEEASEYTCSKITNAKKIILEFDDNSSKTDKYNRYLAWVWVDGSLLQKELIDLGYAKVAYLYADYTYTDQLKEAQEIAETNKVGLWSDDTQTTEAELTTTEQSASITIDLTDNKTKFGIIILVIFLIYLIVNKKARKKTYKQIKKSMIKELKNLEK